MSVPTFTGDVWLRGDEGFHGAVWGRIFNHRRPDRTPAAVVYADDEHDVVLAVRWARDNGWQVVARGGGHAWAAWTVRDDALLLDVHRLKTLELDEATGIVSVGAGVIGGEELAPYLSSRGRFFNGGHCPTVCVTGFILQGGQGWNARGRGWSAERIVALDLVTADGEIVRADAEQNSDLYWAARGAGPGFFAVVTRLHLQTEPAVGALRRALLVFEPDDFDELFLWLYDVQHRLDSRVELVALGVAPPPPLALTDADGSPRTRSVLLVSGVALVDDDQDAANALRPLVECPLRDKALFVADLEPTTLPREYEAQYDQNPEGHRYRVDNAWLDGDPAQIVPLLRPAFTELVTPQTFSLWFSMAPLRPLPDMAFSLQSDVYHAIYSVYPDARDDERAEAWVAEQMRRIEPVTIGQYLGDSDFTRRHLRFMSDENYARLERIRDARDPDRVFPGYLAKPGVALNVNEWENA